MNQFIRIPDGTYTYRKDEPYGPATEVTAVIHDGQLFDLTINGERASTHLLRLCQDALYREMFEYHARGQIIRLPEAA